MNGLDIQRFDRDGTWVKPPGAMRVEITLKGGDGAPAVPFVDDYRGSGARRCAGGGSGAGGGNTLIGSAAVQAPQSMRAGWQKVPGSEGETAAWTIAADELPDEVAVTVGRGGRPGGRDGYALIVTRLAGG